MPTCEYCGDHFPKGGAHSTHERNCDERPGPGGGDVEETASIDGEDVTEPEVDDVGDGEDENVLEFEEDEFEGMIETVRETAHAEGWSEAVETTPEPAQTDVESEGDAETGEETGGSHPDVCPWCAGALLDGDTVADELNEAADEDVDAAAFLAANDGADPEYVCANMGACGYYVEDGDAKQFVTPGGGVRILGWILVGLLSLGAVVVGGIKSQHTSRDTGPRTF